MGIKDIIFYIYINLEHMLCFKPIDILQFLIIMWNYISKKCNFTETNFSFDQKLVGLDSKYSETMPPDSITIKILLFLLTSPYFPNLEKKLLKEACFTFFPGHWHVLWYWIKNSLQKYYFQ